MNNKILINCITFDDGNLLPLLYKSAYWLKSGAHLTYYGPKTVESRIKDLNLITDYTNVVFIEVKNVSKIVGKFQLIFEGVKRNLQELPRISKLSRQYDCVYSISSVMDMILMPFIVKLINPKVTWATVFDNTVPLFSGGKMISGNKSVRITAWLLYRLSLLLLKKADVVFVVRPELKEILIREGFIHTKLIVTGNGVEIDFIKKAKKIEGYEIDALFIGRINEAKGIYDMLKVLEIIVKTLPNFKLALMGGGDELTVLRYKEVVLSLGLVHNIEFLGYVNGQYKYDLIKSSKMFLFLSETESLPQVVMEAVSSGLKTLVYDMECYDMYKNGEVLRFPFKSYESIAKKMIELFETKDFSNINGEKLLDTFSWDRIASIEASCIKLI